MLQISIYLQRSVLIQPKTDIGKVCSSPALETLALDLSGERVGEAGARALARSLSSAPKEGLRRRALVGDRALQPSEHRARGVG